MSSAYELLGLAFSWGSYKGGTAMAQVVLLATYAWVQYQIEVYNGKPHLIGSDNKLELNRQKISDIIGSLLVLAILVALIIFTSAKINNVIALHLVVNFYIGVLDPLLLIWKNDGMKHALSRTLKNKTETFSQKTPGGKFLNF